LTKKAYDCQMKRRKKLGFEEEKRPQKVQNAQRRGGPRERGPSLVRMKRGNPLTFKRKKKKGSSPRGGKEDGKERGARRSLVTLGREHSCWLVRPEWRPKKEKKKKNPHKGGRGRE